MQAEEVNAVVTKLLTKRLGMPAAEITPSAKLVDDLGMDSLDSVEFALAAEREFKIMIKDDDLVELKTVADLFDLLQRLVAQRSTVA